MMSAEALDEIRDLALAAIRSHGEQYTPTRYPWTYSADFLREHPELIPAKIVEQAGVPSDQLMSRSGAAHAKQLWAESIGEDEEALARIFADSYLLEHGIPLGMANTERLRPLGASGSYEGGK